MGNNENVLPKEDKVLIIKGMALPKRCGVGECRFCRSRGWSYHDDGKTTSIVSCTIVGQFTFDTESIAHDTIPKECPLEEVDYDNIK